MRYSLFLLLLLSSCTYNEIIPIPICESDNPSFYACVKPIIDKDCLGCHYDASSDGDLSNYDSIRHYMINGDLLDRIQRIEGSVGFMPKGRNKLDNEQIQVLINWKNNDAQNN